MTDLTQVKDIRDICEQIAEVYRSKMKQAGYDTQGELYNFTWVTELNGSLFQLYFNLPDYFIWSENGRGPGKFPPLKNILKWIQFKRLVPSTKGKAISTKQLVYVVSRKIALHGTEGKHLLQQTIDETYDTLVDRLVEAIANKIENELEKDIEQI